MFAWHGETWNPLVTVCGFNFGQLHCFFLLSTNGWQPAYCCLWLCLLLFLFCWQHLLGISLHKQPIVIAWSNLTHNNKDVVFYRHLKKKKKWSKCVLLCSVGHCWRGNEQMFWSEKMKDIFHTSKLKIGHICPENNRRVKEATKAYILEWESLTLNFMAIITKCYIQFFCPATRS